MPIPLLIAVASAREAQAVLGGLGSDADPRASGPITAVSGCEVIVTGVGKVNAAVAVTAAMCRRPARAVLCLGVAGSLPESGLGPGDVVAASRSVYADEGLQTPAGFMDCGAMGFPLGPFEGSAIESDAAMLAAARPLADAVGPIATVSTCSGTDELARAVWSRTGALAEGMEGAAIAHALRVLPGDLAFTRFLEVRVISNTTGDRSRQRWDLEGALKRLQGLTGPLAGALPGP
jgi:futalosine hydrolase